MYTSATLPSADASAAVLPAGRIQILDVLRGFALFGILLVHLTLQFASGMLPESVYATLQGNTVDAIVMGISEILFSGKFYTIFSLLFGLSFALQLTRAQAKGTPFLGKYAWRLLILGAIGFAHHVHWRGDILSIYAILGFPMLLFYKVPDRWLVAIAFLLILNVPARLTSVYNEFIAPGETTEQLNQPRNEAAEIYYQIIKHGSYPETLRANVAEFKGKMEFQLWSGRIYMTLGYFLLGLYLGRRRLFDHLQENQPFVKKVFKYSGLAIPVSILLAVLLYFTVPQGPLLNLLGMQVYDTVNAAFTFFYVAGISLLFLKPNWTSRLLHLAPVGKMALTNYVLQSIIGILIFYGYGLGLIGEMVAAPAVAMVFPIFFLQVMASKWWLSRFQYGPLEWLWRSLTYLRLQPIRRKAELAA
jgi:uncharacterized protein